MSDIQREFADPDHRAGADAKSGVRAFGFVHKDKL
jgi:hypothetical protein